MFTQRATLLGFVAFCFYLIAVVNSLSNFYYALTWLSMAMLAASLGVAFLSLIGLECRLELTRSRGAAALGEGQSSSALVAMAVSNVGTLNKTNVVLEIRVLDAKNQAQSLRFLLEAVPSGAAIESVLPLLSLRRGRYQWQEARLLGSDVLGLFRMQKRLAVDANRAREIIIGPPVLRDQTSVQGGGNGFLNGNQRALVTRHGEELRGTRPYAPGDDLRHVHWKSSARAGELVVKEWEQTGQSSALVIWDGAANTAWGNGDFNSGEWGLILVASLCHALLSSGIPCEFARLDAHPLGVETRALIGGELPPELIEALSDASAERTISLENALQKLPRLNSRMSSKVIMVSASLSSDLVSAVVALRTRGARVQVFLIDVSSLARRAENRSGKAHRTNGIAAHLPTQSDGNQNIPVSSANFQTQITRLREIGATVIGVAARRDENAETSLGVALRAATQSVGISQIAPD